MKRRIILLVIAIIISVIIVPIGIATGLMPIINFITTIMCITVWSMVLSVKFISLFETKKYYNEFLMCIEYFKCLKHEKYKSYFIYHGKDLEEILEIYDETLKINEELLNTYRKILELNKKFLGKKRYENVQKLLEEIREPGRA